MNKASEKGITRVQQLRGYAYSLRNSDEPADGLASAMIYAGLAEYIASKMINFVEVKINRLCWSTRKDLFIDLTKTIVSKRPTNLEYSIQRLQKYVFPLSDKIIRLLNKIKKDRNDLFHKLVSDDSSPETLGRLITNIQNDVEKLLKIYLDAVDILLTIKPATRNK